MRRRGRSAFHSAFSKGSCPGRTGNTAGQFAYCIAPVPATRLVVEPTNVCNLRCPYCHPGAGRFARRPAMMRLEPYLHLLDEIGDYLLGNGGAQAFAAAWNAERYRLARGLFRRRNGSAAERALPCYDCPTTIFHERWRAHRRAGGSTASFDAGMPLHANHAWNYFWARGSAGRRPS